MDMDKETLKEVVTEVIDAKFASFYVDPEKHYQEHLWLSNLISWSDKAKTSVMKTIIGVVVTGILGLLAIGFVLFYKGHQGP